jgi:hypothetical protein
MGGAAAGRPGDDTPGPPEAEALSALHADWGSTWAIGCGGGRWQAARRDRTGHVLPRASAAGLDMALRVSYGRGSL